MFSPKNMPTAISCAVSKMEIFAQSILVTALVASKKHQTQKIELMELMNV